MLNNIKALISIPRLTRRAVRKKATITSFPRIGNVQNQVLKSMTKADWIKLAMPASITLLAVSILTVPIIANAQLDGTTVYVKQADRVWTIRDD